MWRSPLRLTESGDTELGNLSALRTNTIDLRIRFGCAPNHNLTIDATELRFFMMDDTAANFGAPIVPLLEKLAHAFALIRNRHLAPRDDMHKIAAALFSASLMVGPASASDDIDVIRTVRRFFDSFNNGDLKVRWISVPLNPPSLMNFHPTCGKAQQGVPTGLKISMHTPRRTVLRTRK